MYGLSNGGLIKRPKRVITPARKEQNRVAQRVYRQRQKDRLQKRTEQLKVSNIPRELQPARAPNDDQGETAGPVDMSPGDLPAVPLGVRSNGCLAPSMLSLDHLFPSDQASSTQSACQAPEEPIGRPIAVASNRMSASPYSNTLELTHTMLLRACLRNAQSLGISVEEFFSYKCMSLCSPFYRPDTTMSDDPQALLATVTHSSIPAHLQPTLPQILFPHHPLLDLLPLPGLRTRAIMLAATSPTLLDAAELKRDIVEQGGIVCRGEQPWDMRSWLAASWFMKKWRLLLSDP
ncbi:hypothetical protein BBP40_004247 [Aspergillus hancockii]|nr:hypothetical protein BBP40_004247 [Aspergillus hancockii]